MRSARIRGSSGRRTLVVAAQRGQRTGGGQVGERSRAHAHPNAHADGRNAGVQVVGQRLLHGGCGGRLAVVDVDVRVGRGPVGGSGGGRIRPGAQVRRSAVQPLEGREVAGLR